MARFKFELETVLDIRRNVERNKQLIVAELERDRLAIEGRIRGFQQQIVAERNDLRAHLDAERRDDDAPIDLSAVRMQANASLHLVAKAHQEVLRLAGVHKRIDAARLDLLKATTDRKAVETLRQRRYDAWMIEQNRREERALDEIATIGASRLQEAA